MNRTKILNQLASGRGYHSYLEIGIRNPADNYNSICCPEKAGVDPKPTCDAPGLVLCRSDDFFRSDERRFDLVFVDGDHHAEQAWLDIENSLKCLNPKGAVVIHDALPPAETFTRIESMEANRGAWTGDVWKAVLRHFSTSPHRCFIVDTDWGVAVIDTSAPREHDPISLPCDSLEYGIHFPMLAAFRMEPHVFKLKNFSHEHRYALAPPAAPGADSTRRIPHRR